jgi:hypothetical protein
LLILLTTAAQAQDVVGVASVIDGDTIEVRGTRIRLAGIDAHRKAGRSASALAAPCGDVASRPLSPWLIVSARGGELRTQRQGSLWANDCYLEDINRLDGHSGWAVAYRKYSVAYIKNRQRCGSGHLVRQLFDALEVACLASVRITLVPQVDRCSYCCGGNGLKDSSLWPQG